MLHHEKLPADAPIGQPHIVKDPTTVSLNAGVSQLRLADGVATVLWNCKQSAFNQFFDMNIEHVSFRQTYAHPRAVSTHHYAIERTGSEVVAGKYTHHWKMEQEFAEGRGCYCHREPLAGEKPTCRPDRCRDYREIKWDILVKSKIEPSGNWNEYYASSEGSSKLRDGGAVLDNYRPKQYYSEVAILFPEMFAEGRGGRGDGTSEGKRLAVMMLKEQVWKETKVTKKVTWTIGR